MELRKGYKQTDVGIIPSDWDLYSIQEIAEVKSGKRLPLGESLIDKETAHPYIRVVDMFQGGISLGDIKYVPDDVYPAIKNYRIFKDDIFISVAGTLGIVGKIPVELDGANLTENADRLTNIKCSRDYLLYVLMSSLIQNTIESEKTLGAQPKLALTRIRKFHILLPPTKAEQEAIATTLSDTDELIASLEKLIAKKRNIKQGTMQQLLTGKKRLPRFSGKWEVKQLGELFEITSSKRVFQSEWKTEGIPFYRARELAVLGEKGYIKNELFISKEMYEAYKNNYGVPKVGDMLVTGVGTLGKTYVVSDDHEFYFKDGNIIWFKTSGKVRADFLRQLYLTNLIVRQIEDASAGTTVGTYTISGAKKTTIPFPPLTEQQAIAQVLIDMDAEIEALEQKRDKYKAIKQGMMQELLTGKTRLI